MARPQPARVRVHLHHRDTAWGVLRYRPEDFATTEPFLVLFFPFYCRHRRRVRAAALARGARRRSTRTLVFGTPLVAAGLQAALVRPVTNTAWPSAQ
jgi:uncharacterized membrane protein